MSDRRKRLVWLRDRLDTELESAEGRDVAALSRELRAVLVEIDSIPDAASNAPADEIAKRREERRRAAAQRAASE
ncbi:hypothetical protein [Catenuloplanes atrovinosus]|uniref:Uncharacterized protein n=1 Tax=Catenuloplanes atrovinosus TaxID=137266 RepID=A0AAE4CDD2_9ACTN|nr:hypothetical protein [Catenuloplanes atrovinosus]MDR7278924.1 hypothetical protein [Catenuloplanes atrovinosus]